jgi:hypothetical protein
VHYSKLSSASTGRFAALRLPLAVLLDEKVMSLVGATSTSISSSKSDMMAAVEGSWAPGDVLAFEKCWGENALDASHVTN